MIAGIDSASISTATPQPSSIQPNRQVPINPAQQRARQGGDRRSQDQTKDKSEFRATLDFVAAAPEQSTAQADVQARRASRQAAADKSARNEKRPAQGPTELAADEGARLYAEKQAAQTRSKTTDAIDVADDAALPIPSSNEFLQAASRYAERFFSVAGAYAKPGESLELSA